MIYYSVVPTDEIFAEEETERSYIHTAVNGCPVIVEPLGNGRGRIERVVSTDPSHYMTAGIQPGQVVSIVES